MKPHISTAALLLILAAPLSGCASLRERLTPRSAAVTRVIRNIEDYHGERPPTPRELGASDPRRMIQDSRPFTMAFRIDETHWLRAVYPPIADEITIRAIDALIAGEAHASPAAAETRPGG